MKWRRPLGPLLHLPILISKFPEFEMASLRLPAAAWKMKYARYLQDGSANSIPKVDINSSLTQPPRLLDPSGRTPTTTSNTLTASTPKSATGSKPSTTQSLIKPTSKLRAVRMTAITVITLHQAKEQQRVRPLDQAIIPACHLDLSPNKRKVRAPSAGE